MSLEGPRPLKQLVTLATRPRVFSGCLIIALTAFATLSAQTGPNLTGTWLNLSDPNATDVNVAATLPNALLIITHTGNRFDLSRSWTKAPIKEAHVCDGRENKNDYSAVVERTKCRWEPSNGGTLVIEGTIGREDGSTVGTLRQRYHLDKEGLLIVERTRDITNSSVTSSGARTYTQQYRKVPPPAREVNR